MQLVQTPPRINSLFHSCLQSGGLCTSQCPAGQYASAGQCIACPQANCATCTSATTCTSCRTGFYQPANQCNSQCSNIPTVNNCANYGFDGNSPSGPAQPLLSSQFNNLCQPGNTVSLVYCNTCNAGLILTGARTPQAACITQPTQTVQSVAGKNGGGQCALFP